MLTPLTHADVNRLLKPQHYPQNTFGPNLYLHLPEEITDTRPWLCINQVPYDENNEDNTLNTIKDKLTEIQIETLGTNIEIDLKTITLGFVASCCVGWSDCRLDWASVKWFRGHICFVVIKA